MTAPTVRVRCLTDLAELGEAVGLLDDVWGRAPVTVPMLRALVAAGSYVAGADDGAGLVGASIGFFHAPDARALHSHITGVRSDLAGAGVGTAIKRHQRRWALERGVTEIVWTFDPLVARNAHVNLTKLGARATAYHPNFYGPMPDALNRDDETDRLLVRWDLHAPVPVLASSDDAVPVPRDIEALRRSDLAAARHWRLRVRDRLTTLLDAGGRIVGFDPERGYLVRSAS